MSDISTVFIATCTLLAGSAVLSVDTLPNAIYPEVLNQLSVQRSSLPSTSNNSAFFARLDENNRVQIDAHVNGVPIEFQLDTGASHTIMSAADARLAEVDTEGQTQLAVVGGTITAHYGSANTFDVAGNRIRGHRVIIVEKLGRSLLGMDTITSLGAPVLSIRIPKKQAVSLAAGD